MYLSKLMLSLRSREARFDLGDRYELHRTLMNAFPAQIGEDERVLYRAETGRKTPSVPLLVQSQDMPDWSKAERLTHYLHDTPAVREVTPYAEPGMTLRFRLQANPTYKRDGKRHALYAEDALLEWLARKGSMHGFMVDALNVQIVKLGKFYGKKRQQTWHAVQFDGLLTVTQREPFLEAVVSGIGSAKAFGFGLLSIPYGHD